MKPKRKKNNRLNFELNSVMREWIERNSDAAHRSLGAQIRYELEQRMRDEVLDPSAGKR